MSQDDILRLFNHWAIEVAASLEASHGKDLPHWHYIVYALCCLGSAETPGAKDVLSGIMDMREASENALIAKARDIAKLNRLFTQEATQ